MVGKPRALGVGRVVARRVRRAVAEEQHAAGLELDRLGLGLVGEATDVVRTVAVARVGQGGFPGVGDHAHRAIRHRRVVDRDPHGGAAERLRDLKVGVILVPGGAHAALARLEEDLVEVQRDLGADERRHSLEHLGRERQGADQRAVEIRRAELEVLLVLGWRLAVAGGGDIAEQAIALEPSDVGLERGGLRGVEETGRGHVAATPEMIDLGVGEFHGVETRTLYQSGRGLAFNLGQWQIVHIDEEHPPLRPRQRAHAPHPPRLRARDHLPREGGAQLARRGSRGARDGGFGVFFAALAGARQRRRVRAGALLALGAAGARRTHRPAARPVWLSPRFRHHPGGGDRDQRVADAAGPALLPGDAAHCLAGADAGRGVDEA